MAKKGKVDSNSAEVALIFKALADPTRVEIFQYLRMRCAPFMVEDGDEVWMRLGPTVSEVCCAVSGSKKITAKISHHLKEMRLAGLIAVKRRGKNMICGVRSDAIKRLSDFLNTVNDDGTADGGLPPDIEEENRDSERLPA
jgi:DNA-binding transcriptional ArsR family regulator